MQSNQLERPVFLLGLCWPLINGVVGFHISLIISNGLINLKVTILRLELFLPCSKRFHFLYLV